MLANKEILYGFPFRFRSGIPRCCCPRSRWLRVLSAASRVASGQQVKYKFLEPNHHNISGHPSPLSSLLCKTVLKKGKLSIEQQNYTACTIPPSRSQADPPPREHQRKAQAKSSPNMYSLSTNSMQCILYPINIPCLVSHVIPTHIPYPISHISYPISHASCGYPDHSPNPYAKPPVTVQT